MLENHSKTKLLALDQIMTDEQQNARAPAIRHPIAVSVADLVQIYCPSK